MSRSPSHTADLLAGIKSRRSREAAKDINYAGMDEEPDKDEEEEFLTASEDNDDEDYLLDSEEEHSDDEDYLLDAEEEHSDDQEAHPPETFFEEDDDVHIVERMERSSLMLRADMEVKVGQRDQVKRDRFHP